MPVEAANTVPGDLPSGSVAALVAALLQHRLLEPTQAEELTQLQARFTEPRALAADLIKRGWLTPYQVNQLFLGKGSQLALGSYVVLERLGEGGMGQVFKARHHNLGRIAALKVIRKDRLTNAEMVHRFHREIQAVAALSHPNVVVAFDADQSGDVHYFAMEYVEGTDLGKRVKGSGPLAVDQACDCIRQAALGLQHAHERGMIHRDIKPSNLLVTAKGGTVKVLDLGLARLVKTGDGDSSSSTLTNQGVLMGTPDFIAPEQARNSHNIDARADLYSLGCTFYFLLTGQAPFPADTATEKLFKHWFEEAKPVEQMRPEVPPPVGAVLRKLMAKTPEQRFPTAAALAEALTPPITFVEAPPTPIAQAVQAAVPLAPPPAALPVAVPVIPDSTTSVAVAMPAGAPLHPPVRRYGLLAGGLGGAVLLLVLVWLLLPSRSHSTGDPGRARATEATGSRTREQTADAELLALTARFNDPRADEEKLRQDLLTFRQRYADLPVQALKAAELLNPLRNPLDDLQRRNIPSAEMFSALPREVVAVLGERRWRHWGPVDAAVISPDGQTVASHGGDGLRLWQTKSGRELAYLEIGAIAGMGFTERGSGLFVVSRKGKFFLWDLSTEERKRIPVEGPRGPFSVAVVSPDGKQVAAALEGGTVLVWPLSGSGEKPVRLSGHRGPVNGLCFSADGKLLASAGEDASVRVWDLDTGMMQVRLDGHTEPVRSVAFAPNGKTLTSGGDDEAIQVWDLATAKPKLTLDGHRNGVTALVFVQNGKVLVSGGNDNVVRLWTVADGGEKATWAAHGAAIAALPAHEGSQLVISAAADGLLRLWDTAAEDEVVTPGGHLASVRAIAAAPDGQTLASGSADFTIRLWDLPRVKELFRLRGHTAEVNSVAFSPDGRRLASGSWDGMVRLWDPATGKQRDTLTGLRGKVMSVALSPDGRTMVAGTWLAQGSTEAVDRTDAGDLRLWDVIPGRERATLKPHKHGVTSVAISPDSQTIASASWDGKVRFGDGFSGRERGVGDQGTSVYRITFHPTGNILAAGDDKGQMKFWDPGKMVVTRTQADHGHGLTALAYSPDGKWLASADLDGTILLSGAVAGAKLGAFKLPGTVHGLAFTPDGRHLATANANGTVYLLRLAPPRSRQ
jgi:WD40 repeat protein/tRNA A-37 threonylcarbamoyl transferase component Bud32